MRLPVLNSPGREPAERFSFCEHVWATTFSAIHIRQLGGERRLGGGVDGAALCGRDVTGGWDLTARVDLAHVDDGLLAERNRLCEDCAEVWRAMTRRT